MTDYTPQMVGKIIRQICGEEQGSAITQRHYQAIKYLIPVSKGLERSTYISSIWKPLKGPLKDWPLAFCDASTVDPVEDLVPSDDVHIQDVIESIQVRYNSKQKWCYLREQSASEILVFKAADSKKVGTGT